MFLEHFGLRERPFGKSPDPGFLYHSPTHAEALARLEFGAEERELMVLTGAIGCGKTTLTRALVDRLGDKVTPLLIHHPRVTAPELVLALVRQLELPAAGDALGRLEQLQKRAFELHQAGRPVLLIVDEAQLIPSREVFDEIRLLTNFQLDDDNLLGVLLVGQPELRERLARPALEPLRQRIGIRYHLEPLAAGETAALIRFRVEAAGGAPDLFSSEAIAEVHRLSRGVPRLINSLCALALLDAFGRDQTRVGPESIRSAGDDLELDRGYAPPPPRAAPSAASPILRRRGRPPKPMTPPPVPAKAKSRR